VSHNIMWATSYGGVFGVKELKKNSVLDYELSCDWQFWISYAQFL